MIPPDFPAALPIYTQPSPQVVETPAELPPIILCSHTPQDRLLLLLKKLGIVDAYGLLTETFRDLPIDTLLYEPDQMEWLHGGPPEKSFMDLVRDCYAAATAHQCPVSLFMMIGSYVPVLIGHPQIKKFLIDLFPQAAEAIAACQPPLMPYNDIDLRIEAPSQLGNLYFTEDLAKAIAPLEFDGLNAQRRPNLDTDGVNLGMAEIIYCRHAPGEQQRFESQKLCLDLLPLLQDKAMFKIMGTLQSLINICCSMDQLVKEQNDVWDWCAYILRLTRGTRFLEKETETKLTNLISTIAVLQEFKKARLLRDETKLIYILNGCLVAQTDAKTLISLLDDLRPASQLFKDLKLCIQTYQLSPQCISTLLQFIGLRCLLNPAYQRELPFAVDSISHKGVPHMRFFIEGSYLFIPFDLEKAWEHILELEASEKSESCIEFIKLFGGMRSFRLSEKSPLSNSFRIPVESIADRLFQGNLFVRRLAHLLFLTKLFLDPDKSSLLLALEITLSHQSYIFLTPECHLALLLKHAAFFSPTDAQLFQKAVSHVINKKLKSLLPIVNGLLLLPQEKIFQLALSKLKDYNSVPFEAIEYNLSKGRVLNSIALLESMDSLDQQQWESYLNRLSVLILLTKQPFQIFYQGVCRYGKLVCNFLEQFNPEFTAISNFALLAEQFHNLNLEDLKSRLIKWAQKKNEEEVRSSFEMAANEVKQKPGLDNVQKLLQFIIKYPDKVISHISEALNNLHTEDPETFLQLVQSDSLSRIAPLGIFKDCITECITQHLQPNPKQFDFVFKVLACEEWIFEEHYYHLLSKSKRLTHSKQIEAVINITTKKIQFREELDKENVEAKIMIAFLKLTTDLPLTQNFLAEIKQLITALGQLAPFLVTRISAKFYLLLTAKLSDEVYEKNLVDLILWLNDIALNNETLDAHIRFYLHLLQNYHPRVEEHVSRFHGLLGMGSWKKGAFTHYKNIILTIAENGDIPLLQQCVEALLSNASRDSRYSALIDTICGLYKGDHLVELFREHLFNWKALYTTKSLPLYFSKIIHREIENSSSCDQIQNIGSIITDPDFLKKIPEEQRSLLLIHYFSHFFGLIFAEDSIYYAPLTSIWESIQDTYQHLKLPENVSLVTATLLKGRHIKLTNQLCANITTITTNLLFDLIPCIVFPAILLAQASSTLKDAINNILKKYTQKFPTPPIFTFTKKPTPQFHDLIYSSMTKALLRINVTNPTLIMCRNTLLTFSIWNMVQHPTLNHVPLMERFFLTDRSHLNGFFELVQMCLADFEQTRLDMVGFFNLKNMANHKTFYHIVLEIPYHSDPRITYRFNKDTVPLFIKFIFEKLEDPYCFFTPQMLSNILHVFFDILPQNDYKFFVESSCTLYYYFAVRSTEIDPKEILNQIQSVSSIELQKQNLPKKHLLIEYYLDRVAPFVLTNITQMNQVTIARLDPPYDLYFDLLTLLTYIIDEYQNDKRFPHIVEKVSLRITELANDLKLLLFTDIELLANAVASNAIAPTEKLLMLHSYLKMTITNAPKMKFLDTWGTGAEFTYLWGNLARFFVSTLRAADISLINLQDLMSTINALNTFASHYHPGANQSQLFQYLIDFIPFLEILFELISPFDPPETIGALLMDIYLHASQPWMEGADEDLTFKCLNRFLIKIKSLQPKLYENYLTKISEHSDAYQIYLYRAELCGQLPEDLRSLVFLPLQDNH